jgi:tetratricopeptide (TPR) repeat protein
MLGFVLQLQLLKVCDILKAKYWVITPLSTIMSLKLKLVSWITPPLLMTLILSLLPISNYPLSTSVQAQTSQDRKTEADKLLQQGNQQFQRSQYQAAIQSWQQALMIYQGIRDSTSESETLTNLGRVYRYLGRYGKALESYQEALAISREMKDRTGESKSLNNIGLVYNNQGQYRKALEYFSHPYYWSPFILIGNGL